ncbi:hypothetical protein FRB97_001258 [Tulasnella sp. 331]|nr:hypothetical protein FRB97_001258 [Tulasnella sp. 331]
MENSHQHSVSEATGSSTPPRVKRSSWTPPFPNKSGTRRAEIVGPTPPPENVANSQVMEVGSSFYNERHRLPRGVALQRFDSTTSVFSWDNTEDTAGAFRLALRRIKYFIFQNHPDKCTDEPALITYRYLPILSGCLSPFAILLEIPGLTEQWYIRHESDGTSDYRPNPALLDLAMGLSMACAIIANAALVARFLEYQIKLMTMICIFFLIIHDLINLSTIIGYGVVFKSENASTFGEAFYMVLCSTVCSTAVTLTLSFDLIMTPNFSQHGSGLTRKQRSLVIIVIILISYIAIGSLAFSELLNLTFQNGLYFTVVTIESIGFGDIHPQGTWSTIFSIFYATIGLVIVGLVVNTTRETIMEGFESVYRRRAKEVAKRRREHKAQRAENRAKRLLAIGRQNSGPETTELAQPETLRDVDPASVLEGTRVLTQQQSEAAGIEVDGAAVAGGNDLSRPLSIFSAIREQGSSEESYVDFKRRIRKEERWEFFIKLAAALTLFLLFWLIGAGTFVAAENWTFGRSMYFCWVAFSTVGYGDFTPSTNAGRAIFVVWALLAEAMGYAGVANMTILISVLLEAYTSRYQSALQDHTFAMAISSFDRKRQRSFMANPSADGEMDATANATEDITKVEEEASSAPGSTAGDSDERRSSILLSQDFQNLAPSELATKILTERRTHLDCIPQKVLRYARFFHENVGYFTQARGSSGSNKEPMPNGFRELLEEIAESEGMDERMKQAMVIDDEARRALFFMTYDLPASLGAFNRLLESAEEAVGLIASKNSEWEHLVDVLTERENDGQQKKGEQGQEQTTSLTSPRAGPSTLSR